MGWDDLGGASEPKVATWDSLGGGELPKVDSMVRAQAGAAYSQAESDANQVQMTPIGAYHGGLQHLVHQQPTEDLSWRNAAINTGGILQGIGVMGSTAIKRAQEEVFPKPNPRYDASPVDIPAQLAAQGRAWKEHPYEMAFQTVPGVREFAQDPMTGRKPALWRLYDQSPSEPSDNKFWHAVAAGTAQQYNDTYFKPAFRMLQGIARAHMHAGSKDPLEAMKAYGDIQNAQGELKRLQLQVNQRPIDTALDATMALQPFKTGAVRQVAGQMGKGLARAGEAAVAKAGLGAEAAAAGDMARGGGHVLKGYAQELADKHVPGFLRQYVPGTAEHRLVIHLADFLKQKDARLADQINRMFKELHDALKHVPPDVRKHILTGMTHEDRAASHAIQGSPEARHYVETARKWSDWAAGVLQQTGRSTPAEIEAAKWGSLAMRLSKIERSGELLNGRELSDVGQAAIDRAKQHVKRNAMPEPVYGGIIYTGSEASFFKNLGQPFSGFADLIDRAQKIARKKAVPVSMMEEEATPHFDPRQLGKRIEGKHSFDPFRVPAMRTAQVMQMLAAQDVITELQTMAPKAAAAKGAVDFPFRQFIDNAAHATGTQGPHLQAILDKAPATIKLLPRMVDELNSLSKQINNTRGGRMWKWWRDTQVTWMLGTNPGWLWMDIAQQGLTAEYAMHRGPADMVPTLLAHAIALNPALHEHLPAEFYNALNRESDMANQLHGSLSRWYAIQSTVTDPIFKTRGAAERRIRELTGDYFILRETLKQPGKFGELMRNGMQLMDAMALIQHGLADEAIKKSALTQLEDWLGKASRMDMQKIRYLKTNVPFAVFYWQLGTMLKRMATETPVKNALLVKAANVLPQLVQDGAIPEFYKKKGAVLEQQGGGGAATTPEGQQKVIMRPDFMPFSQILDGIQWVANRTVEGGREGTGGFPIVLHPGFHVWDWVRGITQDYRTGRENSGSDNVQSRGNQFLAQDMYGPQSQEPMSSELRKAVTFEQPDKVGVEALAGSQNAGFLQKMRQPGVRITHESPILMTADTIYQDAQGKPSLAPAMHPQRNDEGRALHYNSPLDYAQERLGMTEVPIRSDASQELVRNNLMWQHALKSGAYERFPRQEPKNWVQSAHDDASMLLNLAQILAKTGKEHRK